MLFQNAECSPLPRGTGELISCLIEHKENMTLSANCKQFLTRMASIVFSDYRLINRFTENCKENIEELQCGRFHQKDDFGVSMVDSLMKRNMSTVKTTILWHLLKSHQ